MNIDEVREEYIRRNKRMWFIRDLGVWLYLGSLCLLAIGIFWFWVQALVHMGSGGS